MSVFEKCLAIGEAGIQAIREILDREYGGKGYVVEFDGYDGFARRGGDIIIAQSSGGVVRVECKTERRYTGNLFGETWSDFLVRPGWAATLETDVLAYYFLDVERLYLFDWPRLRYYIRNVCAEGRRTCPGVDQKNKTVGVLVSIARLASQVGYIEYDSRGERYEHSAERHQQKMASLF